MDPSSFMPPATWAPPPAQLEPAQLSAQPVEPEPARRQLQLAPRPAPAKRKPPALVKRAPTPLKGRPIATLDKAQVRHANRLYALAEKKAQLEKMVTGVDRDIRKAMMAALGAGMSKAEIGRNLGLTAGRVSQIVREIEEAE